MAASGASLFALIVALFSGGAGDLLDVVPTDAYWRTRNVPVAVDRLLVELRPTDEAELPKLIATLGNGSYAEREAAARAVLAAGPAAIPALEKSTDDPDAEIANRTKTLVQQLRALPKGAAVRRLMAIRALGELKDAKALAALLPLAESKEMFVAEYVARAVALIEGKPAPMPVRANDPVKGDVSLLPANCGVVGQVILSGSATRLTLDQLLKSMPVMPGQDNAQAVEQALAQVIEIAERTGNVRVDSLSFGASEKMGPKDGFLVVFARGKYDAGAVNAYLKTVVPEPKAVAGVMVFWPDPTGALAFPSDDRAVLVTGEANQLPVREVLEAGAKGATGAHPLAADAAFAPVVKSLGERTRLWAVCKVSPSYREAPLFQPFDTMTLVGEAQKEGLALRVAAAGKDPVVVKAAIDGANAQLAEARKEIPKIVQQMPAFKPLADFVQTIECRADGPNATVTARFAGDAAALGALPFFLLGARAEVQPIPPAAPPVLVK
jgi:hypothetical protein